MECNKDEALRALSIAEGKLERKDLAGARKFAFKAQALYSGLDGIAQMLTILDVFVVGENKIGGEVDWYSVLGINPWDDGETTRKQYLKLALLVHPDKNKFVGSEGAFKLILEAWSLLSDKTKRLAYNQRRGLPSSPPPPPWINAADNFTSRTTSVPKPTTHNSGAKVPTSSTPTPPTNGPFAQPPPRTNGGENFTNTTTSVPKPTTHNSSAKVPTSSMPTPPTNGPSAPPPPRTNAGDNFTSKTTSVPKPTTRNSNAKVPTSSTPTPPTKRADCKQAFKASETTPPVNINKSTNQVPRHPQQAPNPSHVPGQAQAQNPRPTQKPEPAEKPRATQKPEPAPAGGKTSVASNLDPFTKAYKAVRDIFKRARTEPKASTSSRKKRKLDKDSSYRQGKKHNMAQGDGVSGHGSSGRKH